MATLFIDYDNGNDNYGGTSFALLASGINGRISSTTFSSSTASFPNDGSLINQYLSIFNGTIYAIYQITAWVSSTSLTITALSGGTALANQAVDRQYYIGGRWKTISTGATAVRTIPGDTIRVMGSPNPTSLGINGTWTSSRLLSFGSSIFSSTNASPISITTSSAHGYSTGDTIVINGHTTNTNANGTWTITVTGASTFTLDGSTGNGVGGTTGTQRKRTNSIVTLSSPLTQNIASFGNAGDGRTAWTASANITATLLTTDSKEGDSSDSIAIGASFTTGKAAYKATGTLDLSGYQQISFWIKQTAGTIAVAGDVSLRLCTDTIGDTVVHTCNIEGLSILNAWTPITIDLGTNLNNSIKSIALYIDADKGAQTFLLSNIIACKASSSPDSLTLQSLIGKNTSGETWWAIQSINGTRVYLDAYPASAPFGGGATANNRGYYGTSETVALHKRETIKTALATAVTAATGSSVNESGSSGNVITIDCGYDRTNMSTRNLETWIDGRNGNGYGLFLNSISYITINRLSCIRYYYGMAILNSSNNNTINNSSLAGFNTGNGVFLNNSSNNTNHNNNNFYIDWLIGNAVGFGASSNIFYNNLYNSKLYSNATHGISFNCFGAGSISLCMASGCTLSNNDRGIYLNGPSNNRIMNCTVSDSSASSLDISATSNNIFQSVAVNNNVNGITIGTGSTNNQLINCSTSGNAQSILYINGTNNYLYNCIMNETTEFPGGFNTTVLANYRLYSHNHDNTSGNHLIFTDFGQIQSNTSVRYTNSGLSWALSPTSTNRSSTYPLDFEIAKIAVSANSLVTVKVWMRRTNILLTTGLRIKGGQIAGVPNDITSYMSATADTWEQVTLSFTPTEVGVVEILAECYGGSTYTAYVDDLSITQV